MGCEIEIRGGVMKKILLATVALTALAAQAMAADMPVKAPAYKAPPPAVFSWTGCYVGGNVGGLWVNKEWINRTLFDPLLDQSYGTIAPTAGPAACKPAAIIN